MQNTLKMLLPVISNEAAIFYQETHPTEYQETKNPQILALAFKSFFTMIISVGIKYKTISTEDLASISLEELDYALQSYEANKGVKFSSYFYQVLNNALRSADQHNRRQLNFINLNCSELDLNSPEIQQATLYEDSGYAEIDWQTCLRILTLEERRVFNLIVSGGKMVDAPDLINMSTPKAFQVRRGLKDKISKVWIGNSPEFIYN